MELANKEELINNKNQFDNFKLDFNKSFTDNVKELRKYADYMTISDFCDKCIFLAAEYFDNFMNQTKEKNNDNL